MIFVFTFPHFCLFAEIQVQGWSKADDTVDIEKPGWRCLSMKRQLVSAGEVAISLDGEQRRDLLVNVRPKGLKSILSLCQHIMLQTTLTRH